MENVVYEPKTTSRAGDPPAGARPRAALRRFTAPDLGAGALAPAAWRVLRAGLLSCALLVCSAVAAPVASAGVGYAYDSQFGSAGTGDGEFAGPGAVAVDQASGDVFVMDVTNKRVQRFDADGEYETQWNGAATTGGSFATPGQVATNAAGTSVYVVDGMNLADGFKGSVHRYDAAGVYQDRLTSPSLETAGNTVSGVAVDPVNGDVFVSSSAAGGVIERFNALGVFQEQFGAGQLSGPKQLAIDGNHDVYVVNYNFGQVLKFAGGVLQGTFVQYEDEVNFTDWPAAVAVDPATNEVFVAQGTQIARYSSGGSLQESFAGDQITDPLGAGGVGVNSTTGRVYASDGSQNAIFTFKQVVTPTAVTTPGATGIDSVSATVAGAVNPEGGATTVHFEYGTTTSYGSTTPDESIGDGTTDVPVSANLTGLSPGTTYHFRVVATGPNGTGRGTDQTFTTGASGAVVDGQPAFASMITPNGATLNGTLNPMGAGTSYHFEYGTTTAYGSSTPVGDGGSAVGDAPVSTAVTALTPGTTYHFRLVADNGVGSVAYGADQTFTTAPGTPPTATNVTALSATLNGVVNPLGGGANYHFEYGTDTNYGSVVGAGSSSANGDVAIAAALEDLTPGTTYHFRVVATVNGQQVSSDDATFTTIAAPTVQTDAVTGVTATGATFNATVDAHGTAGTFSVAVQSQDSTYRRAATGSLAAIDGPQSVSVALSDLPPGEEFTVRASATVGGAIRFGDQLTFSTPPGPPIDGPPGPVDPGAPYGCVTPRLNAIGVRPKAGDTVTVTGSDLGVGGKVTLDSSTLKPQSWTATGLTFVVPDNASGTLGLSVNCGRASNAVTLTIAKPGDSEGPSDGVSITKTSVKGSTATVSVKVPGAGKVQTSGRNTKTKTTTVTKAGTVKVKVQLSSAGKKALAKAKGGKLKVTVRVTFTPTGGKGVTKTKSVTFVRKAAR